VQRPSPRWGAFVVGIALITCVFAIAIPSFCSSAQRIGTPVVGERQPSALDPTHPLIFIRPASEEVLLSPCAEVDRKIPPQLPALVGELGLSVESPLPDWSVLVELSELRGVEGALPASRLQLLLKDAEGHAQPGQGISLMIAGHGPAPARDLQLHIELRPDWQDVPGVYTAELHLTPIYPDALPTAAPQAPFPPELRLSPGADWVIPVRCEIGETILVSAGEGSYSLQGGTGLGRFTLVPDIPVLIASNTERWEVRLEGSPFRSGDAEVPLDRVSWAWLGADAQPGVWTSLEESNLILSGGQGRGIFTRALRLSLFVNLSDRAGDYRSQIRLAGASGG
jgi:hypothetical protein